MEETILPISHRFMIQTIEVLKLTKEQVEEDRPTDALKIASAWRKRMNEQDIQYLELFTNLIERRLYLDEEKAKMGCMFRPDLAGFDWSDITSSCTLHQGNGSTERIFRQRLANTKLKVFPYPPLCWP